MAILSPILIGGTTVIVDTETVCNPEKLFHDIKDKKVTIIEIVPVVLRSLLEYISQLSNDQRLLPDLKWMMVTENLFR
jgi:acyl-coenzyme A synthetase/AMP-(fatty) acid ligase